MATIRQAAMDQVEVMAGIIEVQETVITSLTDDLAESNQENLELRAHITRLMADPSQAV